jgi:catechol 2,3-dioxygenase-like lactoylglutathione lyase family enzyme
LSEKEQMMGTGTAPKTWNRLVAEMMVSDYPTTLAWWTRLVGMTAVFTRPAQKLAFLEHPDGAQVMIYQRDGDWEVAAMQPPFGRGAVIQVFVDDVAAVHVRFAAANHPFYVDLREKWRDWGDAFGGQREFLVQDPDGYLVMVASHIGTRPLT